MRILVVENSRRFKDAMQYALDPFGQVVTAQNADDAKQVLAAQGPFDIVFTDFHMRGGSGLEVVDHVNEYYSDLPVVVITAYGTKELTIDCLNRQVMRFMEKPIKYEELKEVMAKVSKVKARSQIEDRIKSLGMLSNLIFHEIGGALQDLLRETQSLNMGSVDNQTSINLSEKFAHLRNSIYQTSDTFKNLKYLLQEDEPALEDLEPVDLAQILQGLRDWLLNWTETHDIQLSLQVPDGAVTIRALPSLIERAIKNILINAVEAVLTRSSPRKIRVFCERRSDGNVRLTIGNNGPVIPQSLRDHLFEFASSSRGQGPVPRGVGLYVVAQVMRRVRGQVSVTSHEEWTEFELTIPEST